MVFDSKRNGFRELPQWCSLATATVFESNRNGFREQPHLFWDQPQRYSRATATVFGSNRNGLLAQQKRFSDLNEKHLQQSKQNQKQLQWMQQHAQFCKSNRKCYKEIAASSSQRLLQWFSDFILKSFFKGLPLIQIICDT